MAIIQQASGTFSGNGPFTPTLPAASSAANLVVVIVAGNTVVSTPAGWTLRTSQVNFMGHYLWDRAGGQSAYSFTANGALTWWIGEVAGGVFGNATSTNNTSRGSSYATPTLTAAAEQLGLASIASLSDVSAAATIDGWTNSYTELADVCVLAADHAMQGVADATVTGTSTSTGATYSTPRVGRSAIIAAYTSSTSAPVSHGSAAGAVSWMGAAGGRKVAAGVAAGALLWAGAATGTAPAVPDHSGSAAGTITWAGTASGQAPAVPEHSGTAAGGLAWHCVAAGHTQHQGSTSGGLNWAGTATGSAPAVAEHHGGTSGDIDWTGTAAGTAPVIPAHDGAAAGSIAWAGTATGHAQHAGTAAGGIDWAGVATGRAPVVGQSSGSAAGALGWAGQATGIRSSSGTAAGGLTWTGTSAGHAPTVDSSSGSASGGVTWAGAATGHRQASATAVGIIDWRGAATGSASRSGTAAGSITWAVVARGHSQAGRDLTATAALLPSPWAATLLASAWAASHTTTWAATILEAPVRADSTEYLTVSVTADHDITTDAVQVSVDDGATWHDCEHIDGSTWRILAGPGGALALTAGLYRILVKVTDNPEIPVMSAGRINVE